MGAFSAPPEWSLDPMLHAGSAVHLVPREFPRLTTSGETLPPVTSSASSKPAVEAQSLLPSPYIPLAGEAELRGLISAQIKRQANGGEAMVHVVTGPCGAGKHTLLKAAALMPEMQGSKDPLVNPWIELITPEIDAGDKLSVKAKLGIEILTRIDQRKPSHYLLKVADPEETWLRANGRLGDVGAKWLVFTKFDRALVRNKTKDKEALAGKINRLVHDSRINVILCGSPKVGRFVDAYLERPCSRQLVRPFDGEPFADLGRFMTEYLKAYEFDDREELNRGEFLEVLHIAGDGLLAKTVHLLKMACEQAKADPARLARPEHSHFADAYRSMTGHPDDINPFLVFDLKELKDRRAKFHNGLPFHV